MRKIDVGVSSCLMGQEVRYSGGHKRSSLCIDYLSRIFEFHPFCPEVAIGLGVPREPVRMVGSVTSPRVVGTFSRSLDVTDSLSDYAKVVAEKPPHLCGYILMHKSPSCALSSAPIFLEGQPQNGRYSGAYVRALLNEKPLLPMEEELKLAELGARCNFIARVRAYEDWMFGVIPALCMQGVADFHSRYEYVLMAHSTDEREELDWALSELSEENIQSAAQEYFKYFMQCLKSTVLRERHVLVMTKLVASCGGDLSGVERGELMKAVRDYRVGFSDVVVPMKLLSSCFVGSIKAQVYAAPYDDILGDENTC